MLLFCVFLHPILHLNHFNFTSKALILTHIQSVVKPVAVETGVHLYINCPSDGYTMHLL